MEQVTFLGHIISVNGIKPTEDKLAAIERLQPPKNVSELKSLLGMINFVGKFVPDLASSTSSMRRLLIKDTPFEWGADELRELDQVKERLRKTQWFKFFDPNLETILITDASPDGLGAILLQQEQGKPQPICCIAKSLAIHERKYCQTERECLAIIWAIEKLSTYLYGTTFTLVTDCKALEYLFNRAQSKPSARLERWILRLQTFEFHVKHEAGITNLADALSRLSPEAEPTAVEVDLVGLLIEDIKMEHISWDRLKTASIGDSTIQKIRKAINSEDWSEVPREFQVPPIKGELTVYDDLVLRGDRIVLPVVLHGPAIESAHRAHQGSTTMKALLRSRLWFPGIDTEIEKFVKQCKPCQMTAMPDKPHPMSRRLPTEPWQDLAADFKEALPNGDSLLVVVCLTTRFTVIEPMKSATTAKTMSAFLNMFGQYGVPRSITADNGAQFKAIEFEKFCHSLGIHLNTSTPYWPERNGAVERPNRNLGRRVKISVIQGTNWIDDLHRYLLLYHSTPQESTGLSPGRMMYGRELANGIPSINSNRDLFLEGAKEKDTLEKLRRADYANQRRGATEHSLEVGDTVLRKNIKKGSLQPNFEEEEYTVEKVEGSEISIKSKDSGNTYRRNSSHLKRIEGGMKDRNGHTPEAREDPHPTLQREKRRCRQPVKFNDYKRFD